MLPSKDLFAWNQITDHDEILTIYKKKIDKIKNTIIALRPSDTSILLKMISKYNSLNYHLEKNAYTIDTVTTTVQIFLKEIQTGN